MCTSLRFIVMSYIQYVCIYIHIMLIECPRCLIGCDAADQTAETFLVNRVPEQERAAYVHGFEQCVLWSASTLLPSSFCPSPRCSLQATVLLDQCTTVLQLPVRFLKVRLLDAHFEKGNVRTTPDSCSLANCTVTTQRLLPFNLLSETFLLQVHAEQTLPC